MQIALLQINPTVGALRHNSDLLIQEIKKASKNGAKKEASQKKKPQKKNNKKGLKKGGVIFFLMEVFK